MPEILKFLEEFYSGIDNASEKGLTLDIVSSPQFRYWMNNYGNLLEFVILVLSIFDISAICIMFFVFSKSPQFHFHLIALIRVLFISFMGYALTKNALIIFPSFIQNSQICTRTLIPLNFMILEHLKISFGIAYLSGMLSFMGERLFATVYLENYEKIRRPFFIAACYFVQCLFGVGISTFSYFNPQTVVYFAIFGVGGSAFMITLFFIIDRVNQQRYQESITVGNSYTLSQRFQLSENIRSSKLLKWSTITACTGNTIVIILYALYWCCSDPGYKRIFKVGFEFFITIYALTFVYVALQACEIWKRTFFNLLGFCRARVIPISLSVSASSTPNYHNFVRTSKGEQMIFSAAQESELYFQQLQSTWS